MIVADTNILSTFERVGEVDLLRQLCKSDRLHVTPATFNELRRAVDVGCEFLRPSWIVGSASREQGARATALAPHPDRAGYGHQEQGCDLRLTRESTTAYRKFRCSSVSTA